VGNDNKGVLHSIPLSQHRITFPTELTASYWSMRTYLNFQWHPLQV